MANITAEISISAPPRLNYLVIDQKDNLHLLLPINSGISIGRDNTCKHAEAVRDFYKVDGDKGAKFQLDEYKKQLDFEIDVLRKNANDNEELIKIKSKQIKQIGFLLEDLDKFRNQITKTEYTFIYLSDNVQKILYDETNLYAVSLRPFLMDNYGSPLNPSFSLNRLHNGYVANYDEYLNRGFQGDCLAKSLMQKLQRFEYKSEVDCGIEGLKRVHENLFGDFDQGGQALISAITVPADQNYSGTNLDNSDLPTKFDQKFKYLFYQIYLKIKDSENPLSQALSKLIGDSSKKDDFKNLIEAIFAEGVLEEDFSPQDVIENFINAGKDTLEKVIKELIMDNPAMAGNDKGHLYSENVDRDSSDQSAAKTKMTLAVKLQFFLAQINVYCINAKLVAKDVDFGKILDGNQQLRDQLLAAVFADDVFKSVRVEKVIFDFFNNKKVNFLLSRDLAEQDQQAIKEQFNQDYSAIKESQHLDNFWLLKSQAQGKAFTHGLNICVDFAWLTGKLKTAILSPSLEESDQYKPVTCNPDSHSPANIKDSQTHQVTLNDDELFADIKNLLNQKTKESLKRALNLLKIKVGNQHFFELKKDQLNEILHKAENTAIKKALLLLANKEFIGDKDILNKFIEIFENNKKQLILTKNDLRALYVGINSQILTSHQISGYESCKDILKILKFYELRELNAKDIAISSSQSAYILVDKSTFDAKHDKLKRIIEENKKKFYLESNRPGKEREDSDPYKIYQKAGKNMNPPDSDVQTFFTSHGGLPDQQKIQKALELCHIDIAINKITADPSQGGYYLELDDDQIRQVEEILYPPIILSQKTSGLLYQLVENFCSPTVAQTMNSSNNAITPQKIKFALEALGINFFGDIEFNLNQGFKIRVTKEVYNFFQKLNEIEVSDPSPYGIEQYRQSFGAHDQTIKSEYKKLIPNLKGLQEKLLFSDLKNGVFTDDELEKIGYSEKIIIEPSIKIETLQSTRYESPASKKILSTDEGNIKIYCPDRILKAFQELLKGKDKILGKKIKNPYDKSELEIPSNHDQLNAFHLHVLARNESANCNGIMKLGLYDGLLDANEIAKLRCLVKATNLVSVAFADCYGGYPDEIRNPIIPQLPNHNKVIIIDQSGLQWQGDHRNTGGLFFYPADPNDQNISGGDPDKYRKWQDDMFEAMYQRQRPQACSQNSMDVRWNGVAGKIDLDQLALGIKEEFIQAFASAVNSSDLVGEGEKIYFKFLKAGMGFFAEGIGAKYESSQNSKIIREARLNGIRDALKELKGRMPKGTTAEEQKEIAKKIFKKVEVIELPFSGDDGNEELRGDIKKLVEDLGLKYQDPTYDDALKRNDDKRNDDKRNDDFSNYIIATTNTGDPHAFAGNEGHYASVDAAISCNLENPNCLNPLINKNFQIKTDEITIKSSQDVILVELDEEIKNRLKILTPVQNFQGIKYKDERFSFAIPTDKEKNKEEYSSLITAGLTEAKDQLTGSDDTSSPPPAKFFLAVMQIASYNRGIGSMKEQDLQDQLEELLNSPSKNLYQENYPQLAREFSAKFQQEMAKSSILTGRQPDSSPNNTAMRLFRASTDENIKNFFTSIATATNEEKENFSELLQNNYKKLSVFTPSKKLAVRNARVSSLSRSRSVSP